MSAPNNNNQNSNNSENKNHGGRPSVLPLNKQKLLVHHIIDTGGIFKASTDSVVEKSGFQRVTAEFRAAQNKVTDL